MDLMEDGVHPRCNPNYSHEQTHSQRLLNSTHGQLSGTQGRRLEGQAVLDWLLQNHDGRK